MVALHRDGWVLLAAVSPEVLPEVITETAGTLDDPEYVDLLLGFDTAYDWSPDDPRLRGIAESVVVFAQRVHPDGDLVAPVPTDPVAYALVSDYGFDRSPAWRRVAELVDEVAAERGYAL